MKHRIVYSIAVVALLCVPVKAVQKKTTGSVPRHPSKLAFDSLEWNVPSGLPFREVLDNGCITYSAVDSSLPTIKLTAYLRYGSLADPVGKEGLAALFAATMRSGGTKRIAADSLDELIDLYALRFGFSASETQFTFSASFLSDYSDKAFDLMKEMLFYPVFDSGKIEKERAIILDAMRHRFDNPGPTLGLTYQKQMYSGEVAGRMATDASVRRSTRKDLVAMHRAVFSPVNMILCVSGYFSHDSMKVCLEKLFPDSLQQNVVLPFPKTGINPLTKAVIVHKPISQAYVRLGLPLFQRPHPDYYAMSLLNEVFGGGGFTSRLGQEIRSNAGLTYSIYSVAESNYSYPGTFYINFFTKNESFNQAVSLTLKEVGKIIADGVTDKELENAKSSLIGEIPSMFRSPGDIVSTYGWNEYYHRSPDHYQVYERKLREVTKDDLVRVAQRYLKPDSMIITVVGDTTKLLNGDDGAFSLKTLKPKVIVPPAVPLLP